MEVTSVLYNLQTIKKSEKTFKRGEFPVRIRLAQLKEKSFIPLGYSSRPENWDEELGLPKPSHPYYKELSQKISNYLEDLDFQIKLAEKSKQYLSL